MVLLGFLNIYRTLATNWNKVHIRHVAYGRHIQFHMPFAHWIGLSIVMHHGSMCNHAYRHFKFQIWSQDAKDIEDQSQHSLSLM